MWLEALRNQWLRKRLKLISWPTVPAVLSHMVHLPSLPMWLLFLPLLCQTTTTHYETILYESNFRIILILIDNFAFIPIVMLSVTDFWRCVQYSISKHKSWDHAGNWTSSYFLSVSWFSNRTLWFSGDTSWAMMEKGVGQQKERA